MFKFIFTALVGLTLSYQALAGGDTSPRPSVMFTCENKILIAWDNVHTYVILGQSKRLSGLLATEWSFDATSSSIKFPNGIEYTAKAGFALGTVGRLNIGHGQSIACHQTAEER